ncbi:hypothetical protein LPJ61_000484 [Coemansia biformis]|uniref:DH domain-containing protein n=1 Tax=Coemansia biformis TaxID=1286918 RepID=A0A9W7YIA0_9FUNG|nr:hypothetical protein LPJ61_000484 [Coemansia biformis]
MPAHAQDTTGHDAALDLLEAIAMDLPAEYGRTPDRPATLDTPAENSACPAHMSARLAWPSATRAQDGADTSDEELYLRRVSVLYHELWTADWIEAWPASPQSRESSEPPCPVPPIPRRNSRTDGSQDTTAAGFDCPAGDAEPEATAKAKITTAARPKTMPDTIVQLDNGCSDAVARGGHSPEPHGSWVSLVNMCMGPERSSVGAATDATAASSGASNADSDARNANDDPSNINSSTVDSNINAPFPPRPVQRQRGASVHGFSPSDLADVLVGTVRRLEDDHTLRQHKRWSVVKELAVTEAHYLQDLLLLRAVFYEPLTAAPAGALLRPEDARLIFGNLDQVIDCARALVEYLTVAAVYEASRCVFLSDEGPRSNSANIHSSTSSARVRSAQSSASASSTARGSGREGAVQPLRVGGSRPASQPEAMRVGASDTSEQRNSAWADISIAQAFLLTSQRMEHVYAQYCQSFAAASQRIIELKRAATTAIPATAPATPVAADYPPSTSSPMADHLRGWLATGGPTTHTLGYSSPTPSVSSGHSVFHADAGADDTQPDLGCPDTVYATAVYQHITRQAQCLAGKTNSWDLSSLLIKPVQRILKYPLLIRSLLGLTRTHTLDHSRLEKAAQSVERIAEAINAVHRTNGLRISTATTGSSLSAPGDDAQGRVARELRRVLRRRTGNASHLRPKPQAEGPTKERPRKPTRARGWARENPDRSLLAVPGAQPPTGAAALVEQHENRIAEVIRALREWESSVGTVLRQQLAVAARWRDLYTRPDGVAESVAATSDAVLCVQSAVHDVGTGGNAFVASGADAGVFGDLDSRLQKQWQLAAEVSRRARHGQKHGRSSSSDLSGSAGVRERERESPGTREPWEAARLARATAYHAALETIYGSLYPNAVCSPLHSKVYPVLSALLQIYGDGPRYILGEIARASSGGGGVPAYSTAEPDGYRLAKLHGALAEDLPRLFEHERTAMRLLFVQIVDIQRGFFRQMVDLLSGVCAAPNTLPPYATGDQQRPSTACPSQHPSGQQAGSGSGASSGPSRCTETLPPLAAECMSQIRAGMWRLAQESQRHSPAQCVVKPRHRGNTSSAADGSDTASDHSIAAEDGSSASVSGAIAADVGGDRTRARAAPAVPAKDTVPAVPAKDTVPAVPAKDVVPAVPAKDAVTTGPAGPGSLALESLMRRRSGDAAWSPVAGSWVRPESNADPQPSARPASSKQLYKRPGGLMGRIANLRAGRVMRGHQGSTPALDRLSDGALDSIKPRSPQCGSGAGMGAEDPPIHPTSGTSARVRAPSKSTHRARSEADMRDAAVGWAIEVARFEPLPLVDSIRFSKGFVDAAFQLLELQDLLGSEAVAVGPATAPNTGTGLRE